MATLKKKVVDVEPNVLTMIRNIDAAREKCFAAQETFDRAATELRDARLDVNEAQNTFDAFVATHRGGAPKGTLHGAYDYIYADLPSMPPPPPAPPPPWATPKQGF